MSTRPLTIIAAALLLVACGDATDVRGPVIEGDGASTDPAGAWVLHDATPTIDVPGDARVTLEVTADDDDAWQVGGTSACNSYGGQVVTDDSAWRGGGYDQTDMGCDEPRMSTERDYLAALTRVDAWARPSPDELVLTGSGVELRFAALPPAPTAELTATSWVLDGLVTATGPDARLSSPAGDAEEATL